MHERGPFTIKQNKFVGANKVIKQPVLIFDKELGFVYAYGDKKDSDFIASYNRKKELVKTLNKDMYESMTLIDMFDYKLTNCYVERRHCTKKDTSPFLYEEQLFTGEYFVKDKIEL